MAHLQHTYDVEVEAENEEEAFEKAKDEVFGVIEPYDIEAIPLRYE